MVFDLPGLPFWRRALLWEYWDRIINILESKRETSALELAVSSKVGGGEDSKTWRRLHMGRKVSAYSPHDGGRGFHDGVPLLFG